MLSMQLFNSGELTELENEQLQRAIKLKTIVSMEGWGELVSILSDISQRLYPNPKEKKYKYSPWAHLEKDYTYARGGTEVVSEFLGLMTQQADIVERLNKKVEDAREAKKDDKDLYAGLRNVK